MAVGPNFQDSETQAAIAAQSGGEASEAVEPEVKETTGAEETVTDDSTPEPAAAEAAEGTETPSTEESKPEESAATVNMEELRKMNETEINAELAKVGYTQEDLGRELGENDGKLTDDTIAKLNKHFGEEAVKEAVADLEKQFAEAKPAAVQKAADKVQKMNEYIMGKLAGGDKEKGKENFKELSAWAQKNLDERQLKLINKKLASGDQDLVDEALEQAVGAWKKGQRKPMMTGDSAAAAANAAPEFKPLSRDEFKNIMKTEKYQTDLEYQAQVDARRRKTMETEGAITPEFSHLRPPI
jgi:hypothetical protein